MYLIYHYSLNVSWVHLQVSAYLRRKRSVTIKISIYLFKILKDLLCSTSGRTTRTTPWSPDCTSGSTRPSTALKDHLLAPHNTLKPLNLQLETTVYETWIQGFPSQFSWSERARCDRPLMKKCRGLRSHVHQDSLFSPLLVTSYIIWFFLIYFFNCVDRWDYSSSHLLSNRLGLPISACQLRFYW